MRVSKLASIHAAKRIRIERDDSRHVDEPGEKLTEWTNVIIEGDDEYDTVELTVYGTPSVALAELRSAEDACTFLRGINANLRRDIAGTDHAMLTESLCADLSSHQADAGRLRSELEIVSTIADHALAMLNRVDEGEPLSMFDDGALNHMNEQMRARAAGEMHFADGRDHDCPECAGPVFQEEVGYCSTRCVRQSNQDDPEARS